MTKELFEGRADWIVSVLAAGTGLAGAGVCLWFIRRKRFFVRRPDGFCCFSRPSRRGAEEFRWRDVEWIGIRMSPNGNNGYAESLEMKLRTSPDSTRLLTQGGLQAVMHLLILWSGDRWERAPQEQMMSVKFERGV